MDKPELIRTLQEAHQQVLSAIGDLPAERLGQIVRDDWTGKDLLAHLAWWQDHSAQVIEDLRAGREPEGAEDLDELNATVHRDHADDPPEVARGQFRDSFVRLLGSVEALTDEELFVPGRWPALGDEALVEMVLWDSSRHYEGHRADLDSLSG